MGTQTLVERHSLGYQGYNITSIFETSDISLKILFFIHLSFSIYYVYRQTSKQYKLFYTYNSNFLFLDYGKRVQWHRSCQKGFYWRKGGVTVGKLLAGDNTLSCELFENEVYYTVSCLPVPETFITPSQSYGLDRKRLTHWTKRKDIQPLLLNR